jgi:hypothetical protein
MAARVAGLIFGQFWVTGVLLTPGRRSGDTRIENGLPGSGRLLPL